MDSPVGGTPHLNVGAMLSTVDRHKTVGMLGNEGFQKLFALTKVYEPSF